jgi:muramoyltetrapeptide carboxypeptidase LdcA involved in peptidoglycan recycling
VEYPTTRRMGSDPADRAADLHTAFADPTVKALITSIGGEDEIRVLPYLDADLIRANPKPFFGFSDNTCLLTYLYRLGIVAYHGGAVMTQFGRQGAMHPLTRNSLLGALRSSGTHELAQVDAYNDVDLDWSDPAMFAAEPPMLPCGGWVWHNPGPAVTGIGWGGNIEVLSWLLMADRNIPAAEELRGGVLFLETSEELPAPVEVYRILRAMGERGLLGVFPAVLFGRPKSWALDHRTSPAEKVAYQESMRAAVLRGLSEYAPDAMAVLDVDFGHTDPQQILPYGGQITVDGIARRITVRY